jgi:hypothetical protein
MSEREMGWVLWFEWKGDKINGSFEKKKERPPHTCAASQSPPHNPHDYCTLRNFTPSYALLTKVKAEATDAFCPKALANKSN